MMNRPKVYRLTITTLTPLHIGTGRELLRGYDYVTHDKKTWIINEEIFAEQMFDTNNMDGLALNRPASEYLTKGDFHDDNPLFRYILSGEPRSTTQGSSIREVMKDAWDRPYIPGSSLKGALRTAILYALFHRKKAIFSMQKVGGTAKSAAQNYEHDLLISPYEERGNKDPNYDLLRLLQVSDSTPDYNRRLSLLNVSVAKGGEAKGAPIEVEAVRREVVFTASMTIDTALLKYTQELKWDVEQVDSIIGLMGRLRFWTDRRFKRDTHARDGLWKTNHDNIRHIALSDDEFMLQLGWGGGWTSKTLGDHLTKEEFEFAKLVNDRKYNMLRKGKFEVGDQYPKTRRVVVNRDSGNPLYELGWIKVKMEEA